MEWARSSVRRFERVVTGAEVPELRRPGGHSFKRWIDCSGLGIGGPAKPRYSLHFLVALGSVWYDRDGLAFVAT